MSVVSSIRPAPLPFSPASRPDAITSPNESFGAALRRAATSIAEGDEALERVIQRSRRGTATQEDLLALQARVYRFTQELELASKLVDKSTQAVRQTLTSQS